MEGRAASGALTTRGAVARKQRARHECGCPVCLPPRPQVPAFTHALFTHAVIRLRTRARAAHMRAAAKRSLSLRLPSSCGLAREGEATRCHERRRRSVRIEGGKPGLPHLGVTCGRSRRASRRGQRAPRTPPRAAPAMSVSWPVSSAPKGHEKIKHESVKNFGKTPKRSFPRQSGGRPRTHSVPRRGRLRAMLSVADSFAGGMTSQVACAMSPPAPAQQRPYARTHSQARMSSSLARPASSASVCWKRCDVSAHECGSPACRIPKRLLSMVILAARHA